MQASWHFVVRSQTVLLQLRLLPRRALLHRSDRHREELWRFVWHLWALLRDDGRLLRWPQLHTGSLPGNDDLRRQW